MPDTDDLKKTVDLDTSGPAMDVDVPETKEEDVIEQKEAPVEEPTVRAVEEKKESSVEDRHEEKKDDTELEQYSDSVQKRIAKLTKKWREAERQKDEALTYAQRVLRDKKETEAKLSKIEPNFLKTSEESIVSGVEAAKAKLAAAREANDLTAEAEAMQSISELGVKKARLEEAKLARENLEKQPAKPEVNLTRQPAAQPPDPKAEAWSERNSWFGQDTAMTYTAFDLHKKLTEQEGFDPSSDEYYSEIDKRIRLEFPHKFANNSDSGENTRPAPRS
jgi:chromosome segregation ATPase